MHNTVVFVLGMGRSGTSLLARVLSLCGGALPERLVGAVPSNPKGHWEPVEAMALNEGFLQALDSSWFDPAPLSPARLARDRPEVAGFLLESRALLRDWPGTPFLVLKEPRVTALASLWFEAARAEGYAIRVVVPVRDPDEVGMSLATRDGLAPAHSALLWLKYGLLAEHASRAVPRVFVDYRRLVEDWRHEADRMSRLLGLDFSGADASAIDAFVTPALYRQRRTLGNGPGSRLPGLQPVYEAFAAAARDVPIDTALFDRVRGEFEVNAVAWSAAIATFFARLVSPDAAALADQVRERQRILAEHGTD